MCASVMLTYYKLTVAVSAFVVLLTVPGGAVLRYLMRTICRAGHFNSHLLGSFEGATAMSYFPLSFTLMHDPKLNHVKVSTQIGIF